MNRKQVFAGTAVGLALGAACMLSSGAVFGQSQQSVEVPKFQYDPTFPQPLPASQTLSFASTKMPCSVDGHS